MVTLLPRVACGMSLRPSVRHVMPHHVTPGMQAAWAKEGTAQQGGVRLRKEKGIRERFFYSPAAARWATASPVFLQCCARTYARGTRYRLRTALVGKDSRGRSKVLV